MARKPSGYWKLWTNVEEELHRLMTANRGLVPTRSKLEEEGLGGMLVAIQQYHGGLQRVRERLGVADSKYCPECDQVLSREAFRFRRERRGRGFFRDNICQRCNGLRVAAYRRTAAGRAAEIVRAAKHRAKSEGWAFDLSKEWVAEQLTALKGRCEVTGLPFGDHGSLHAFASPYVVSLDRIDSAGGYTRDNVQFVLNWVNWSKKSLPMEEFIRLCRAVAQADE